MEAIMKKNTAEYYVPVRDLSHMCDEKAFNFAIILDFFLCSF